MLVSFSLGLGRANNTGLVDDAFIEFSNFEGKVVNVLFVLGNVGSDSGRFFIELSNSGVSVFNEFNEEVLELVE